MIKKKILNPIQNFIKIESLSGILLFGATILALILANSPLADWYHDIWSYKIGIGSKDFGLFKPLILWINDGLMAIFFFVIGLEIKREILIGELNSVRKASLPVIAALGGMLVPVFFYLIFNQNEDSQAGWGISMATDIAFSLAILNLLGKRVPLSLKVFLMAFAIIDDIGAVLVIAIFYSEQINWLLILYAALPLALLYILSYYRIYSKYLLVILGVFVWIMFLKAGIHPTIAGVLLAFSVPIHQRISMRETAYKLEGIFDSIKIAKSVDDPILTHAQIQELDRLETWISGVQSPLQHLEHKLHNWVAYFIMPLFAFANAGVSISTSMEINTNLIWTIFLSLLLGKFLGIGLFSYSAVKLKLAEKPKDISWPQIAGIGALAGVGFTMSIFIANLAFPQSDTLLSTSKMGILLVSLTAGLIGYLILKIFSKKEAVSQID